MVTYMTDSISFIHAADLHLDSPFKGLTDIPESVFQDVRESTFTALNQLVQTAIMKQVDFILLVGDLFDNDKQSLKAQVQLRKAFQTLQQHDIDVYLSYGNHDYLLGNPYRLAFSDNVHIFSEEQVSHFIYKKNEQELATIYGFSYHQRAVQNNKTKEYLVENKHIPFHIATLHGALHGNQEHDPYAPFTLQQLQAKAFDYWSLGHIHERAVLATKPPIIYPGNTQGRHRNESGAKGCYYVKMTPTDTFYEFVPVQNIQFVQHRLDVSHCVTIDDIEQLLLTSMGQTDIKQLIHLTFYSIEGNLYQLSKDGLLSQIIEVVNEAMIEQDDWQFIYTYRIETVKKGTVAVEETFVKEIEKALGNLEADNVIADLYRHPTARKYLEQEDELALKEAAKKMLLDDLLHMEESDVR